MAEFDAFHPEVQAKARVFLGLQDLDLGTEVSRTGSEGSEGSEGKERSEGTESSETTERSETTENTENTERKETSEWGGRTW